MALSQITIKSFKSIVDQTIDLGQLNVFIGTNGSGKSNLLEAIGVLSSALDGQVDYNRLANRGVRLSAPEVFKSSFKDLKRQNTFSLEAKFGELNYHTCINANNEAEFIFSAETFGNTQKKLGGRSNAGVSLHGVDKPPKIPVHTGIASVIETLGYLTESEQRELKTIQQYAIYALSTPILRGVSPDSSNKEPLGLYGGGLSTALFSVVSDRNKELSRFFNLLDWFKSVGGTKVISDKLQSSHVHTGRSVVRFNDKFMRSQFNELYAYDVSEGALYILFILVLLLHKKSPSLFAMDNIDNALNPGMVRGTMNHIIELLKEMPHKQVLMTTHNPTTLDAIDLFNEQHRLFVVQRDLHGHTEIKRIMPPPHFTRETWIEKYQAMPLSEIWLSGLIGGLAKGF